MSSTMPTEPTVSIDQAQEIFDNEISPNLHTGASKRDIYIAGRLMNLVEQNVPGAACTYIKMGADRRDYLSPATHTEIRFFLPTKDKAASKKLTDLLEKLELKRTHELPQVGTAYHRDVGNVEGHYGHVVTLSASPHQIFEALAAYDKAKEVGYETYLDAVAKGRGL